MLARIFKPSVASVALRHLTGSRARTVDSRRAKSHAATEVQHAHDGGHHEVDHHGHHDVHREMYERLWHHKATIDWLPKPEGNWQEINGKTQAYYNQLLVGGVIAFILSMVYMRLVIVTRAGALTAPPYHLIGKEDFPGSKYDDAAGAKEK